MLEESEALQRILGKVPPPAPEQVPLDQSIGRYATADLYATLPLPGFDNSAMDDYALHAADCGRSGISLTLSGEQPAGPSKNLTVRPGQTIRLFTGAPLPRDTAAVIMQEDTLRSPDGLSIVLTETATTGEFIRWQGADLCAGQQILTAGCRVTPARLAVLASQGLTVLPCAARPRAAVLTTGDELIPGGQPLTSPGQLYNSNGPMLQALLQEAGASASAHHSPDHLETLTETAHLLLAGNDLLVLAGGVSTGDHDLVKPALEALGIPLEFWRVHLKPGKPFLFTTHQGKLIFGLPGNPASAFVTAVLFLLPALRQLAGASGPEVPPRTTPATVTAAVHNSGGRPHYLRGHYQYSTASFTPIGLAQSHAAFALAQSNALLRLAPGTSAAPGSLHPVVLF